MGKYCTSKPYKAHKFCCRMIFLFQEGKNIQFDHLIVKNLADMLNIELRMNFSNFYKKELSILNIILTDLFLILMGMNMIQYYQKNKLIKNCSCINYKLKQKKNYKMHNFQLRKANNLLLQLRKSLLSMNIGHHY